MDQYWAASPEDIIAREIMARVTDGKEYFKNSAKLQNLRKSYATYYGDPNIKTLGQSLQAMHVNHYANLIRHVLVDITSQRPAWEPQAINTDSETEGDTQLASGLLDYYMRDKQIEPTLNEAIEKCLFLDEGWISVGWDVNAGDPHGQDPETGNVINIGDIDVKSYTILDVTRDVMRRNMDHEWYILRTFENKWNIAAKHPELADKITRLTTDNKKEVEYELNTDQAMLSMDLKTDLIPVYTLRHAKTPAVPSGRLTIVLTDDIALFDGPLPYKGMYVYPAVSSKKFETSFGHASLKDILPTQDAFNATVSAILTNQAANAIQNFQAPKGAAPKVTAVKDGLNIWEYDPKAGKIERMDLLNTAPEVFKFAEFMQGQGELISGVSQISRGTAPPTMSGTAMALLAQQSIQFSSGVALSRTLLQENIGTAIIELLQTYAVVPRVAQIVGKSKRAMMKKFQNTDLQGISRIRVNTANPLTKTGAGRMEIANNLLATPGMIENPQQYLSVLADGNLEPLYEHQVAKNNLIRSENEWIMEGREPEVIITDDDATHILEHAVVASSPEARENPQVLAALFSHIQRHIEQGKTKDPVLAAMLKQQSFFQAPPPMPGVPPPPGAPQGPGPAPIMDNQNPITQQAEQTNLPSPAEPPNIQPMGA